MSEQKHDGDLGDRYSVAWHYNDINIQDQGAEFVALTPGQAIKLLAWLEEEYPNMRRILWQQAGKPSQDYRQYETKR